MERYRDSLVERTRTAFFLRVVPVLAVFLIIAWLTIDDYGISADEKLEVEMVQWNLDLVRKGEPIPRDLKHYGTLFNFAAAGLYRLLPASRPFFESSEAAEGDWESRREFLARIRVKHSLTFVLFLLTCVGVAGILGSWTGGRYVWVAPVVLALFPRFWGHSFFNPKDIPFAALFTLGTWGASGLVGLLVKGSSSATRLMVACSLFGILAGMITGVRAGGLVLLFFFPLAHWAATGFPVSFPGQIRRNILFYVLIFLFWFLTVWALHPASWPNPVYWLLSTLKFLSAHQWSETVLFQGRWIPAGDLPWYYLPVWVWMVTPLALILLSVAGIPGIAMRYRELNPAGRAAGVLILLQMFFLPAVAIFGGSTIYDGIRQFLFIIPPMAVLSAFALIRIYERMRTEAARIAMVVFVLIVSIPIVWDMIRLHPYQYCYFNRMIGGLQGAHGRYETDYWGLSMKEGMEWINSQAGTGARVVSGKHLHSSATFASPSARVVSFDAFERHEPPFYYIARPRWDEQDRFPDCEVVHRVLRQEAPLTIVKYCR